MKRNSLRLGTVYLLLGNGVYAGCQWLTVVILSQWGGVKAVGDYGLALAIFGPLFVFSHLGLRQVLTIDFSQRRSFPEYLISRNLCSFAALAVAGTGVALFDADRLPLMSAVGLWKLFEANLDIFHGLFQRDRRFDLVAWSRLASGPVGAALFAIAFWQTGSVTWAVIGLAAGAALALVLCDLRFFRALQTKGELSAVNLRGAFRIQPQAAIFWLALPLGWAAVLISLRTNIPRYLVEWKLGTEALGAFVAIGYLITIFTLFIASFGRAATPYLADRAQRSEWRDFRALLRKLLAAATLPGVLAVAVAYFFSRPVVQFIYGPEVAAYHELFVFIMIVVWFVCYCSVLNHALEALHLYKKHFMISLAATAICLLAVFTLLQMGLGLTGAALGWAAALAFQACASLVIAWGASSDRAS